LGKQSSEHQSITFLKSLCQHCDDGKGFINLRFLPSAKNHFIPLSEIKSIPAILETHRGENAYFGVATRVEGDGTKKGIVEIPSLWCEIDSEGLGEEAKNEIRQRYQDFPLRPSVLLNSGGGIHIYWKLKTPATKEEIPLVESLLKRIALYFGGDLSSTDASRILRLPKTLNYKYVPPREVTITAFKPQREYNLSDFDFLPSFKEAITGEEKPPLPEGWEKGLLDGVSEGERNVSITRLAGRYIGKGLSREEILPILMDANSRFKPPLPLKEIEACLDSTLKTHQKNHPEPSAKEEKDTKGINYHLTTLNDVFEYPEPTFLIDPILVEGTVLAIGAYTGTGKSVTALSIEKAILSGKPLWGKYPVLKTGPVLLVDEETPKGFLKERIKKMSFCKTMPLYFLHFQDVRLDKDEYFNALMSKVEEVKPVLVVIDSLIRVHRQKEDDATSMSKVVDRLRKIANWGTTVLVIHHHKKGEGPLSQMLRGSSDIPGGIDVEYALIPKDGYLQFSSVKTRTKPLDPIRLKMEINETSIEMVYLGTEAEEVLTEVLDVLRNRGRLGVNDIREELKAREFEVGINRLREMLRNALGKEIQGEKEKGRGKKWVYWVDDSSRFTALYNTVKSEETNQNETFLRGMLNKEESTHEETTQCFQGDKDSSRAKKQAIREELRNKDGYEVRDDGQRTY
jgi:hypothetical protein